MKRLVSLVIFLTVTLSCCSNDETVGHRGALEQVSSDVVSLPQEVLEYVDPKTVYPFPGNDCVECTWYFCPPLDSVWQKQICIDYCEDPPQIAHETECQQYLQCDPAQYLIEQVPCTTEDGYPGKQDKVCNKGQIQYTECVTDCEEENCNYLDDDCDGEIDEGQTNACDACGIVPTETCNDYDDDCDGDIDEELMQPCSTLCGTGFEICDDGNWVSCSAPQPAEEICDGFDNDCDGKIDEDLECICTIQDVGKLMPCLEPPMLCGQGFKTCECTDETCTEFKLTECMALCHWSPPVDPAEVCDPFIGIPLKEEECNNFDDNCNQLIDEDIYSKCYTGPNGTINVGICKAGEMTCSKGTWGHYKDNGEFSPFMCKDEVTPQQEICNGLDDDCDGIVDWGEEMSDTDVLFIVDWSGSMVDEISAVMIALNQFASKFSDEEVIKWSFMRGPVAEYVYYTEYLELYQDLIGFTEFLSSLTNLSYLGGMSGSFEMLLDAIYLSVAGLSSTLPMNIDGFQWAGVVGIFPYDVSESIPPIKDFKLNWRPEADRIIIVFSDEYPQSYLVPELYKQDVMAALVGVPQLKLYTFSKYGHKPGWEDLAMAGGGKWFQLTNDPAMMYNSLMEIISGICKGASDE